MDDKVKQIIKNYMKKHKKKYSDYSKAHKLYKTLKTTKKEWKQIVDQRKNKHVKNSTGAITKNKMIMDRRNNAIQKLNTLPKTMNFEKMMKYFLK